MNTKTTKASIPVDVVQRILKYKANAAADSATLDGSEPATAQTEQDKPARQFDCTSEPVKAQG